MLGSSWMPPSSPSSNLTNLTCSSKSAGTTSSESCRFDLLSFYFYYFALSSSFFWDSIALYSLSSFLAYLRAFFNYSLRINSYSSGLEVCWRFLLLESRLYDPSISSSISVLTSFDDNFLGDFDFFFYYFSIAYFVIDCLKNSSPLLLCGDSPTAWDRSSNRLRDLMRWTLSEF